MPEDATPVLDIKERIKSWESKTLSTNQIGTLSDWMFGNISPEKAREHQSLIDEFREYLVDKSVSKNTN